MTNLIKIVKAGEPAIKVHPDALAEHEKLGWQFSDAPDEKEHDSEGNSGPVVSEAAKKLAEESGIDIATVIGTGSNGNITKGDVQKLIDAKQGA